MAESGRRARLLLSLYDDFGAAGWEWPFMQLVFSFYPETWEGERAAMQEWTDTYIAVQTGNPVLLARVRAMYVQVHLAMRNGDPE